MNRQQMFDEILRLHEVEKIKLSALAVEEFLDLPQYLYLSEAYHRNRVPHEKWHHIVRFALFDPQKKAYMYNRVLYLVTKYIRSYLGFFLFRKEMSSFYVPDRLASLNRLLILYEEYFDIYKSIINFIHFDFDIRRFY